MRCCMQVRKAKSQTQVTIGSLARVASMCTPLDPTEHNGPFSSKVWGLNYSL